MIVVEFLWSIFELINTLFSVRENTYNYNYNNYNCWSVGWLVGWSVGRSVGRLVGWLVGWLVGRLVGRSVGRSVGRLVGWLVGWLVGRPGKMWKYVQNRFDLEAPGWSTDFKKSVPGEVHVGEGGLFEGACRGGVREGGGIRGRRGVRGGGGGAWGVMRKAEAGDARWKAGGGRREAGEGERESGREIHYQYVSLSMSLSLYLYCIKNYFLFLFSVY